MAAESFRIYHNARCSKSRSACALLEAKGVTAGVVDYLRTPPTRDELLELFEKWLPDSHPGGHPKLQRRGALLGKD